jgi:phenylacetic acid degradation operon negative regulatory protein
MAASLSPNLSRVRQDAAGLGIRPLKARSVVLSALLGFHPPQLPVSALVRIGELFGIAEGTIRVGLTRMVADGDVVADSGAYRLSGRLLDRQARQDESTSPHTRRWRGEWETAIVTAPPRALRDRVALRRSMAAFRLAELREGVWLRPANLVRERPVTIDAQCSFFESRPEMDAVGLARSLWDLDAWALKAVQLRAALEDSTDLAEGFMVTAAVLRHLLADPILPPELLPDEWPAMDLREAYARFNDNYRVRLGDYTEAFRGGS